MREQCWNIQHPANQAELFKALGTEARKLRKSADSVSTVLPIYKNKRQKQCATEPIVQLTHWLSVQFVNRMAEQKGDLNDEVLRGLIKDFSGTNIHYIRRKSFSTCLKIRKMNI